LRKCITIIALEFSNFFVYKDLAMHGTTLSFRVGNDFADEVRTLASLVGLKSSDYIRQAVLEKNEQVMAQRIAALSKELSAEHLAFNESLNESLQDGLD
jgi:uncharacterized protein (DUF1778 family)